MSALSDYFENALAKLVFNGTAIANIADNAATAPLTNLYVSLHTADPGEAGDQTTSEVSYTGYARLAVSRDSGGWTVTGGEAALTAAIEFATAQSGDTGTITHFAVGVAASGVGEILGRATATPNIVLGDGVVPRLNTDTKFTFA